MPCSGHKHLLPNEFGFNAHEHATTWRYVAWHTESIFEKKELVENERRRYKEQMTKQ
jgi:hypothetical protein